jgi:flagellin
MTSINFSAAANNAANIISKNQRSIDQSMTRLASGTRFNSSADSPSMIASYNTLTAAGVASRAAVQSMNHGIAYISTVDNAAATIEGLLVRMKDLAVQASSTAMNAKDRYALDFEFQELGKEWIDIATNTQFAGNTIMQGADIVLGRGSSGSATDMTIQVDNYLPSAANTSTTVPGQGIASNANAAGAVNSGGTAMLNFGNVAATLLVPATGSESISVAADAKASSIKLTTFIQGFADSRAKLGGALNAMAAVSDSLSSQAVSFENSKAVIGNTDYAAETAKLSAGQIISQASTAILAQANAQSATILSLLK